MKVKLIACIASTCCTPAFSRSRANVSRFIPTRQGNLLSRKRNRSRQQRDISRYYIRLTNCAQPHQISAQWWAHLVITGMIESEKPGSRIARGRHLRAIFLDDNDMLVFVGDTYALGIPLMTNSKIMDAYFSSFLKLDDDERQVAIQNDYNPFVGGAVRLRPTETENIKSLANIQPLVQWREELRQNAHRAA